MDATSPTVFEVFFLFIDEQHKHVNVHKGRSLRCNNYGPFMVLPLGYLEFSIMLLHLQIAIPATNLLDAAPTVFKAFCSKFHR